MYEVTDSQEGTHDERRAWGQDGWFLRDPQGVVIWADCEIAPEDMRLTRDLGGLVVELNRLQRAIERLQEENRRLKVDGEDLRFLAEIGPKV